MSVSHETFNNFAGVVRAQGPKLSLILQTSASWGLAISNVVHVEQQYRMHNPKLFRKGRSR